MLGDENCYDYFNQRYQSTIIHMTIMINSSMIPMIYMTYKDQFINYTNLIIMTIMIYPSP